MDPFLLAADLFGGPGRSFPVALWDGRLLAPPAAPATQARLVLRRPEALTAFFPPASEVALTEAFLDGLLDVEGDLVGLLAAAALWEGPRPTGRLALAALRSLGQRALAGLRGGAGLSGALHSPTRDLQAVRHHYDVSDELYRLFLDREMVYSCAYFPRGEETLEEAQRQKLELVCRKLDLSPGQRLLDVGCGWGALVRHAVRHHRVRAVGITLSANQLSEARRRGAVLPPGSAEFLPADYRTVPATRPFDRVASVGMMEHVGRARLDLYFETVHRLLRPGGLFLNHAIADGQPGVDTLPWASRRGGGFIARHIFPDGELLPVAEVVASAERAGFEVRDLESLREHYERTLLHWLRALEDQLPEAEGLVGRRRARAYRLYLAGSAAAFRLGRNSVFQLLLSRRGEGGRAEGIPPSRARWYREPAAPPPEPPGGAGPG